jgi:hypothetical protein
MVGGEKTLCSNTVTSLMLILCGVRKGLLIEQYLVLQI